MPRKTIVNGPLGSIVAFSTLAVYAAFTFGGLDCIKKNDSQYWDLELGQLKPIDPSQPVTPISVDYVLTPPTIIDVTLGNGYIDFDGHSWIRLEGGAYHVASKTFSDNPPPVLRVATDTELKVDQ